ncbi:peroxidase PX5 [Cinnamomum micranthum f. kanehirae]|uniref:Peroxidase n=1 Tax=Cinnamomum micranthum f. kanehirae TaxID=337451 RepID=A0A443PW02_9MAGN|nr:peroxidase PX5 [Cinnamomum micranthum f. kanehirae]
MASMSVASLLLLLLVSSSCPVLQAQIIHPPIVKGLSYRFYKSKCPNLEKIVKNHLTTVFRKDIGQAAALLRIHFHDCFVQGCDGSVLLDGSTSSPSEKDAPPNLTLRPEAFVTINELRELVHKKCGQIVSCSDIVTLAARDSVALSGGPHYRVPLGRRDGLSFATTEETLASLPGPFENTTVLIAHLKKINLHVTDLVALSGAHTIGISHCTSFEERLYPKQDPTMDQTFAKSLKVTCPTLNSSNTTPMDIRSPNSFDNKYYVNLINRQVLFTSDQDLLRDLRTRPFVRLFGLSQTAFFEQFAYSMVKMGQLSVLTGTQGEIRMNCSAPNPRKPALWSVVDDEGEVEAV